MLAPREQASDHQDHIPVTLSELRGQPAVLSFCPQANTVSGEDRTAGETGFRMPAVPAWLAGA